jgi:hypothetical protein
MVTVKRIIGTLELSTGINASTYRQLDVPVAQINSIKFLKTGLYLGKYLKDIIRCLYD